MTIEEIDNLAKKYLKAKYPMLDIDSYEEMSEIDYWDMLNFAHHLLNIQP